MRLECLKEVESQITKQGSTQASRRKQGNDAKKNWDGQSQTNNSTPAPGTSANSSATTSNSNDQNGGTSFGGRGQGRGGQGRGRGRGRGRGGGRGEASRPPSVGSPPLSDASSLVPTSLAPYFRPTPPSNTVPTGCSWENHAAVPAALALDAIISMTRSLSPPIRTRLPTTSPPPKDYGSIAPASTPSPKNPTSSNSVARRDPVRTRLTRLRHLFFVQCNFPCSNEALSKLS